MKFWDTPADSGNFFEVPAPEPEPAWRSDEGIKLSFAIAWAKDVKNPFTAACAIFNDRETNKALWASNEWVKDPFVIAKRDSYLNALDISQKLLSKEGLAAKLLDFCDEKDASGRFFLHDGKDRLAALKLYAEVQHIIGTAAVDMSTKNFTNNVMNIKFVEPDKKIEQIAEQKVIEHVKEDMAAALPMKIKLVG